MNPNELRLGNWVYKGKTSRFPMQVVSLGTDYVYLDFEGNQGDVWEPDIEDMCGIPLTEDVLLKCGFNKQDSGFEAGHPDRHEWLEREFPVMGCVYQCDAKDHVLAEINDKDIQIHFLHQLQNLHHALTGEELKINLAQ